MEAKEAAEHPGLLIFEDTSGPGKDWKDKELQADIAEEVKKTVFFEHGERVSPSMVAIIIVFFGFLCFEWLK